MSRNFLASCFVLFACAAPTLASSKAMPKLTAAQIVERNVSARGGLQAWHAIETMSMSGKLDAGGTPNVQLPFVLELKRPRKTRFELAFQGKTALQVYDGVNGWKLRPFLGRTQVEPFSAAELKAAALQSDLDGQLIDYAAKGTKIELEAMEKVEGHDAYKLKLTMKNGEARYDWVDAETFLELKVEGNPTRLDGKLHPVEVFFRDYRTVDGLVIPYLLETTVQDAVKVPGKGPMPQSMTQKIIVESVVLNSKLVDSRFTKPRPEEAEEKFEEAAQR